MTDDLSQSNVGLSQDELAALIRGRCHLIAAIREFRSQRFLALADDVDQALGEAYEIEKIDRRTREQGPGWAAPR